MLESAPAIVSYNFEDIDWAAVAVQAGYDAIVNEMNALGSSTWVSQVVFDPFFTASSPVALTVNNGSENIAAFGVSGQLFFYWMDSSGAWHQELVAPAGAN
ncbi:MAG TPA: hypothetical protein VMI33_10215 [Streptosporangiaceae bacterium]|nr:hypothetical protein [Streptosporangiaceae bacterium]